MFTPKRYLTEKEIDFIVDFIEPRPQIPFEVESVIVAKKKEGLVRQLSKIQIYDNLIPNLKQEIHKQYINSIITPGECVGIIGAQSMGEYSTQATLNTFHVAGIDTGSNSGISRFQDLINASKTAKVSTLSLFFHNDGKQQLSELKSKIITNLVEVKLSSILISFVVIYQHEQLKHISTEINLCLLLYDNCEIPEKFDYCLKIQLSKQKLLQHRLHVSTIKKVIDSIKICKAAFLPLNFYEEYVDLFIFMLESDLKPEVSMQQIFDLTICGIDGITRYDFKKNYSTDEWYIETKGGTFSTINSLSHVFDLTKTKTTSVWDIYNTFGIEATKQFLIQELQHVMDGVNVCHIQLLVERMTFSGYIEPITRYTMRNDSSPLSRASFEESFETFMKSAKYNEVETFNSVSASVIGGKKPKVGTYFVDLFLDLDKLTTTDEQYDDELVFIE